MKKILYIFTSGVFLFLCHLSLVCGQGTETITITTYYPSPYGSFNELSITRKMDLGVTSEGYPGVGDGNYGAKVYFSGAPDVSGIATNDNSDPIWMARYNTVSDQSELRINMGDTDDLNDKFVIGYTGGTGWNPSFTVQADGRVRIGKGTTPPPYLLTVDGRIFATGNGDSNNGLLIRGNSIETPNYDQDGGANAEVAINYAGYSPGETAGYTRFRDFNVYNGKGNSILRAEGATGNVSIVRGNLTVAGIEGVGVTNPLSTLHMKATNNLTALRIESSGSGSWSQSSALDLVGSYETWRIFSEEAGGYNFLKFQARSTDVLTVYPPIGTTPRGLLRIANSYLGAVPVGGNGRVLEVGGHAGKTAGGTTWEDLSDGRLKNVQAELKGSSLDKVMQLRPVSYKWNTLHDSKFGAEPGLKYGFIAQEVKKVIPEFITQDKEGYYWYNPSGMEAIFVAAFQEQQEEIESQKKEIILLRGKLEKLEKIVAKNP